jgi:hypothetical protein
MTRGQATEADSTHNEDGRLARQALTGCKAEVPAHLVMLLGALLRWVLAGALELGPVVALLGRLLLHLQHASLTCFMLAPCQQACQHTQVTGCLDMLLCTNEYLPLTPAHHETADAGTRSP